MSYNRTLDWDARVREPRVPFEVDLRDGGHPIECSFIRCRLTKGDYDRLASYDPNQEDADEFALGIELMLATDLSWNLTRGGLPLPVTKEILEESMFVLLYVFRGWKEELFPKEGIPDSSNSG